MTVADAAFDGFAASAEITGQRATLGVRGGLDLTTTPQLGALFDAVIATRSSLVILDLADCDFLDPAALWVVVDAARRLAASGGDLAIRSAPADVMRTLDLNWPAGLDRFELPAAAPALPHPDPPAASMPVSDGLGPSIRNVRRVTTVRADEGVIDGALRLVVALARATVGGADGVSVSLRRRGHLATVAASDRTILDMDARQYGTGEGPCVSASAEGHWFHAESLATEERWPAFTPQARALGINAILSSPLLAHDQPIGALNIYSRIPAAFEQKDQQLAATFASEASMILTHAAADVTDEEWSAWRRDALRGREVITLAQGAIMARSGVDEDDAYSALRRLSVETGSPLREHAEHVIGTTRGSRPGRSSSTEDYLG